MPGSFPRIKIMAQMNIAEKRLPPQDGQIKLRRGRRSVNIRVSTLPTVYGERWCCASWKREDRPASGGDWIFPPEQRFLYGLYPPFPWHYPSDRTDGMRQTTTLYSALNYLNNPAYNIVTVEDPIEFRLEGSIRCR